MATAEVITKGLNVTKASITLKPNVWPQCKCLSPFKWLFYIPGNLGARPHDERCARAYRCLGLYPSKCSTIVMFHKTK